MEVHSCSDLYMLQKHSKSRNRHKRFRICCSQSDSKCHQIISVVDMEKRLRFQIPLANSQTSMLGKPQTLRKEFGADPVHRPATGCAMGIYAAQINEGWQEQCKQNNKGKNY